ncbi:MAG: hypothetical protein ABIJ97_01505 [Bacteroidota bacterium]
MKNHCLNYYRLIIWLLIAATFIFHSCGPLKVAPEIFGTWKSDKYKITVRYKAENMKSQFISDVTVTTLTINSDKTVNGNIGSAVLENGKIRTNWLLPTRMTGCAYTIQCDLVGKIFENDPLEKKS